MNVLHVKNAVSKPLSNIPADGGEMGAAVRAFNWAATPLGRPELWPRTLKTCLRLMLASRQPMLLWWGPGLINFYNDACLPLIGAKHPHALGQPAQLVWAEIWDQIEDRVHDAMVGQASYSEAEMLLMRRNFHPEETYYTFSFSPVPEDDGSTAGIICINSDDTDLVIGARRLALLRELASRTWDADTVSEVYVLSARALASDPRDMPFALIYRFEEDGAHASLCSQVGISTGHAAAPEIILLESGAPWPISEVMRDGKKRLVTHLSEKFPDLPKGPWRDSPEEALILPLATSADVAPRGVLILGANPYRCREDDSFDNFAALVARQIALAIVSIESFEAERERANSADSLALEIEHRRRIERHQNLLLDELNHRVKNTLATVQAMAIQTMKGVDAPAREAFLSRLFALSSQHDLLTLDNWEGASLDGVVRRALRPWREEEHVRFRVAGPPVHLEPKRALALGMAFHELATNAAKYGALSNVGGAVHVNWTIAPDSKTLNFIWEECGGPPVVEPLRRGFGLRLIEQGLGREISSKVELDFKPHGLICRWSMRLS
jgi:two-component sensor histidine kinase